MGMCWFHIWLSQASELKGRANPSASVDHHGIRIFGSRMGRLLIGFHMSEDWSAFDHAKEFRSSQNRALQISLTRKGLMQAVPTPVLCTL
jgi:hypothetical protein